MVSDSYKIFYKASSSTPPIFPDANLAKDRLTIFTPTYNRAYTLRRLYQSLLQQDKDAFVWLVIDDGSTDDTRLLIDSFKSEGKINIEYIYQENQGKMKAHNAAALMCRTELFMCLDSDDSLTPNAVAVILNHWAVNRSNKFSGCVAPRLTVDDNGNPSGMQSFPNSSVTSTMHGLYDNGFDGETAIAFRTEVIRAFPFLVQGNEKFFNEWATYRIMDDYYEFSVLNRPVMYCQYQKDGLSQNKNAIRARYYSPNSSALAINIQLYYGVAFRNRIQLLASYIALSLVAKKNVIQLVTECYNKLMCALLLPLGWLNKLRYDRIVK